MTDITYIPIATNDLDSRSVEVSIEGGISITFQGTEAQELINQLRSDYVDSDLLNSDLSITVGGS